jgi:uncharacterized membrane protein
MIMSDYQCAVPPFHLYMQQMGCRIGVSAPCSSSSSSGGGGGGGGGEGRLASH